MNLGRRIATTGLVSALALTLAACASSQEQSSDWRSSKEVRAAVSDLSKALAGANGLESCALLTPAADSLEEVEAAPTEEVEAARALVVKRTRAAVDACGGASEGDPDKLLKAAESLTSAKEALGDLRSASKKAAAGAKASADASS